MAEPGQRDRRRRHFVDRLRILMHVALIEKCWRSSPAGADPERRPSARPIQDRSYQRYALGEQVPRDVPGGFIDRLEQVLPGNAPFYRSPVWDILRGEPPHAPALAARLGPDREGRDVDDGEPNTFAELEALLVRLELARAEGRHVAFARAVATVERAKPRVRFIPEFGDRGRAVQAIVHWRLKAWRADVEERRKRGLLDPAVHASSTVAALADRGGDPAPGPSPLRRYAHLAASLAFLGIASSASDRFAVASSMLMFAVHGFLAVPATVGRSGVSGRS